MCPQSPLLRHPELDRFAAGRARGLASHPASATATPTAAAAAGRDFAPDAVVSPAAAALTAAASNGASLSRTWELLASVPRAQLAAARALAAVQQQGGLAATLLPPFRRCLSDMMRMLVKAREAAVSAAADAASPRSTEPAGAVAVEVQAPAPAVAAAADANGTCVRGDTSAADTDDIMDTTTGGGAAPKAPAKITAAANGPLANGLQEGSGDGTSHPEAAPSSSRPIAAASSEAAAAVCNTTTITTTDMTATTPGPTGANADAPSDPAAGATAPAPAPACHTTEHNATTTTNANSSYLLRAAPVLLTAAECMVEWYGLMAGAQDAATTCEYAGEFGPTAELLRVQLAEALAPVLGPPAPAA